MSGPTAHFLLPASTAGRLTGLERPSGAHAGLWFDKCVATERPLSGDPNLRGEDLQPWLRAFTAQLAGEASSLSQAEQRRALLIEGLGGRRLRGHLAGRLVTGVGLPHALENGFAWHPTLGVPWVPASGVKGVLRAALRLLHARTGEPEGPGSWDPDLWLGHEPRAGGDAGAVEHKSQAGRLIVFDALPLEPVKLEVDVLTPHHRDWIAVANGAEASEDALPTDWDEPTPIHFLTAAAGTEFSFGVALRPGVALPKGESLDHLAGALTAALEQLGLGAKTGRGYGGFGSVKKVTATDASVLLTSEQRAVIEEEDRRQRALAEEQAERQMEEDRLAELALQRRQRLEAWEGLAADAEADSSDGLEKAAVEVIDAWTSDPDADNAATEAERIAIAKAYGPIWVRGNTRSPDAGGVIGLGRDRAKAFALKLGVPPVASPVAAPAPADGPASRLSRLVDRITQLQNRVPGQVAPEEIAAVAMEADAVGALPERGFDKKAKKTRKSLSGRIDQLRNKHAS